MPLHFKESPLQQLANGQLGEIHDGTGDYRTNDGLTTVDVLDLRRNTRGAGIALYPFGSSSGATLMVRGSYETLPVIRFEIKSPNGVEPYMLRDGRAYDVGIGIIDDDRPAGWSLGAHSFVIGGIGRLHGERGDGIRLFGEGGGGISFGAIGVQFGVKIAYNRLTNPRPHSFYTVPMSLRATVSF